MTFLSSTILIVNDVEESALQVASTLPKHDVRIIKNEEEGKKDFLILHAKQVVKEAYIASERTKYIIFCGEAFTVEAQNSLLKILEEPPKNVVFIMITNSKSGILKTIFSRLPHHYLKTKKQRMSLSLDLAKMELKDIYQFIKEHQRIGKSEAKELIESLLVSANEKKIKLTSKELESFSVAMKLCELNSRPINILTTLLLSLLKKR